MLVYLLRNTTNGKCYVGQHKGHTLTKRWNANLNNARGNAHFDAALKKYGANAFERRTLCFASCQAELDLLETLWIHLLQTTNPKFGYNLQTGGLKGVGRHVRAVRERIREGNLRHWAKKTPEQMLQIAENAYLRWHLLSPEQKEQWRQKCRERWWKKSEQERAAIIEKVRRAKLGVPRTDSAWNKGLLGWNKGLIKSPETCRKLSEARKRYWAQKRELARRKPVMGIEYQRPEINAANRKQPRATSSLKGGRYACAV